LNEWYHVAYTRNTKTKLIQVIVRDKNRNVVSLTETSFTPTETYLNSKDLQIGTGLSGYIDEVRISNIVRPYIRTGVEDVKQENAFIVYPNPSSGMVQLKTSFSTCKIRIVNTLGQLKYEKEVLQNEILDLSGLQKGLYFIQLNDGSKTGTEKLILK